MKDLIKKVRKYISENATEYIIIGIICAILSGAVLAVVMINRSTFTSNETAAASITEIHPNVEYTITTDYTWTSSSIPIVYDATTTRQTMGSFSVSSTIGVFTGNKIEVVRQTTPSKQMTINLHNGTSTNETSATRSIQFSFSASNKSCYIWIKERANSSQSWTSTFLNTQHNATLKFNDSPTIPNDAQVNIKLILNEPVPASYTINGNITNGSINESEIDPNTENFIQITPNDGYTYPESIQYTGSADDIQYYSETGEIVITNPTSDFTITATCPREITMKAGYYLVNPEIIPSTESSLGITFRIVNIHTSAQDFTGAEPLSSSESVTIYDSLNRWTGLYDGLYATSTDDPDTPYALWTVNPVTGQSSETMGNIIHILDDQTTTSEFSNALLYIGDDINTSQVMAYWAYPLVSDRRTIAYTYGFDDGINQSIIGDTTTGVVSAIFEGLFGTIFKVEIFPGFPLYIFILIPLVFALLGIILWLIRGR